MPAADFDILIRAGRVVCPASRIDGPGAVGVLGGRCVAVGPEVKGTAEQTLEIPDGVLLPGLIDLHAHPARSISVFGVDPDQHELGRGVTTVLSQGDAGAANWRTYLKDTIEASKTRVLLALNLSRIGESTGTGCCANIDDADVAACVAAAADCPEHVWGIAVNASHYACGPTDPREVVRRGLEAARGTGLPLLYGMRRPEDWPLQEQLAQLRPGDVVTYCFRSRPHCIIEHGRVLPAVREARARGILFDVGHGTNSFDFQVAEAALADGFPPDTISTDLQRDHLGLTPRHVLPLVMSKLRAAGMAEADVFAAVTSRPAAILRRPAEIGSLLPGSCADFTVLKRSDDGMPLVDCHGKQRPGSRWLSFLTVRSGEVFRSGLA